MLNITFKNDVLFLKEKNDVFFFTEKMRCNMLTCIIISLVYTKSQTMCPVNSNPRALKFLKF